MRIFRSLAVIAAASIAVLLPNAAHAATLNVDYDATGWSRINSTESDLWIKPTTLSTGIDSVTGAITGHLPLIDADTKFHVLGFLPIKAQVNFEEAAPLTGNLIREGTIARVESTASYYIRLSNVLIGGVPTYVTDNCRTKEPVVISANTPAGEAFNITRGGRLTGEYTIGDFEHCFLSTGLINLIVPGSGNTVDITVSNGRLG